MALSQVETARQAKVDLLSPRTIKGVQTRNGPWAAAVDAQRRIGCRLEGRGVIDGILRSAIRAFGSAALRRMLIDPGEPPQYPLPTLQADPLVDDSEPSTE